MPSVRPAEIADASRIVALLRQDFPPELLQYTIHGCSGIETYTRDSIGCQGPADAGWYVLGREASDVLGFAEIRRSADTLFLSQLYVDSSFRGPGIGPSLMYYALKTARTDKQSRVELDVFEDNPSVLSGHLALGFAEKCRQKWVDMPLTGCMAQAEQPWFASGLAQANRIHDSWGFSEFTLQTPSGAHRVGRLGDRLFRVTDSRVLTDGCALAALRSIAPERNLVCIDKIDSFVDPIPEGAVVRSKSARLAASLDDVLGTLSGFLAF